MDYFMFYLLLYINKETYDNQFTGCVQDIFLSKTFRLTIYNIVFQNS